MKHIATLLLALTMLSACRTVKQSTSTVIRQQTETRDTTVKIPADSAVFQTVLPPCDSSGTLTTAPDTIKQGAFEIITQIKHNRQTTQVKRLPTTYLVKGAIKHTTTNIDTKKVIVEQPGFWERTKDTVLKIIVGAALCILLIEVIQHRK